MDDEGYNITFKDKKWKVSRGAMIIALGKKTDTIYMTTNACRSIAVAASKEDHNLWHQRLGHMSEKGLKIMHSKGKLPGLQSIDLCECCILANRKELASR